MNILHVNYSDIVGGAAIAAYRLHQGLLAKGIDSRMLVEDAKTVSARVATFDRKRNIENLTSRLTWRLGLNYISILSTFNVSRCLFYQNANIINLHNLHGDYFNYLAIPTLTRDKPAVFTLHDIWSFTGHCAFNYGYTCERWKTGCGNCPDLDTFPSIGKDNTRLEWKLKNWVYTRSNLTIVAPSTWLATQAKQSMLSRFSIYHIPHGINTEAYKPLEPEKCRLALGIQSNQKVLLISAANLHDKHKGGDLLLKALTSLPASLKAETILLVLGEGGEMISKAAEIKTINLGYVSSDLLKSIAYSAADLFVFPTRADIFGLVLQESMACGTPMVSFKVGGVPDLVRPNITGYLAEPENTQDFRNGIVQLLEDEALRSRLSQNCRAITLKEYSLEQQAERYIKLYHQLLNP